MTVAKVDQMTAHETVSQKVQTSVNVTVCSSVTGKVNEFLASDDFEKNFIHPVKAAVHEAVDSGSYGYNDSPW